MLVVPLSYSSGAQSRHQSQLQFLERSFRSREERDACIIRLASFSKRRNKIVRIYNSWRDSRTEWHWFAIYRAQYGKFWKIEIQRIYGTRAHEISIEFCFLRKLVRSTREFTRSSLATLIDRPEIARDVAMIYRRNLLAEITHWIHIFLYLRERLTNFFFQLIR